MGVFVKRVGLIYCGKHPGFAMVPHSQACQSSTNNHALIPRPANIAMLPHSQACLSSNDTQC
eukprot:5248883-Lingulodinium_polyedra.AAC.1